MSSIRIIAIVAAFVAVGFCLCPQKPDIKQVAPDALLDNVIKAEYAAEYSADQVHDAVYLGKSQRKLVHCVQPGCCAEPGVGWYYKGIKANYIPLVEGEDRVAGRDVWTLRLMPNRDKYPWRKHAPWKQLWVDKETYVVLASREWTSENKIKRSMRTRAAKYIKPQSLPELSGLLESTGLRESAVLEHIRKDKRYFKQMESFMPQYIPGGFSLVEAQCTGKSGCRFTYSDGLYCINISCDTAPDIAEQQESSIKDCGQCLVYNRTSNSCKLTVTADLPSEEFNKLIRSIK